jgi:hypothetical protein
VEERPERPVRIAVIIFVDILLFEVDRRGGDAVLALQIDLAGEMVGLLARPAEPQPTIFPERRRKRHGKPTLRPFGAARLGGGNPVGYDDQAAHLSGPNSMVGTKAPRN